jgi:serine/threonine-protein kinase
LLDAQAPTRIELRPNMVLGGKFRVTRRLGEGGMGAVFVGEREDIGGEVAIKILLPGTRGPEYAQRFRQVPMRCACAGEGWRQCGGR